MRIANVAVMIVSALVVAGVVLETGGCAGKTATSTDPGTTPGSAVGAAGGTVTSSDGKATVQIPAGALSTDVAISITAIASPTITSQTTVGTAYQLGPSGTTFAKPVTVTLPFEAGQIAWPLTSADVRIVTAPDGSSLFTTLETMLTDASHVSALTTHFSVFVPSVPSGPDVGPTDGGSADTGVVDNSGCVLSCEGPANVDGGIGCDCKTTCHGIVYDLQCVCGQCTCYQDGVAGKTTTATIAACDTGGEGIRSIYNTTCGYPASPNQGGGGGPTSGDGGGSCP